MNYEMKKFGRRKFWMPVDWKPGELVTWEELDEPDALALASGGYDVATLARRVGIVLDIRLDGVDARPERNGDRGAYFTMDITSDSGFCRFHLQCVVWKEHSQALGHGPGAVWSSHSEYSGHRQLGGRIALSLPYKLEGEAACDGDGRW